MKRFVRMPTCLLRVTDKSRWGDREWWNGGYEARGGLTNYLKNGYVPMTRPMIRGPYVGVRFKRLLHCPNGKGFGKNG